MYQAAQCTRQLSAPGSSVYQAAQCTSQCTQCASHTVRRIAHLSAPQYTSHLLIHLVFVAVFDLQSWELLVDICSLHPAEFTPNSCILHRRWKRVGRRRGGRPYSQARPVIEIEASLGDLQQHRLIGAINRLAPTAVITTVLQRYRLGQPRVDLETFVVPCDALCTRHESAAEAQQQRERVPANRGSSALS